MSEHSASPQASLTRWRELRLDLQPTSQGKIVQIRLPDKSTFSRSSKGSRKVLNAYPDCKSEDEYRKRHNASAGGVFFRSEQRFPRNILWRCLEDGNTLELRAIDLSNRERSEKTDTEAPDAPVVLQFTFPAAIRNGCVGFAELDHGEMFDAFIFADNKELYTLRIPSIWFTAAENSNDDPERWCRSSRPGTLGLGYALRLTSAAEQELLFAMADGRLVRLTRQKGADGSGWEESAYSEGQWSSFRGLLPWQGSNKIKFEGQYLEPSTVLAALPSPDGQHLITATLSHTLKIWNLQTGKPVFERDLLGLDEESNEASNLTLDPGHKNVLTILQTKSSRASGDIMYYIVTYSPHKGGCFKVWGVRDLDLEHDGGVKDMFAETTLRVPDPSDNAVWNLADFKIGISQEHQISFWLMLRLNRRYKIYSKAFSSLSKLGSRWHGGWDQTSVAESLVLPDTTAFTGSPSEPLALALDATCNLPWLVSTNSVSAVRTCTGIEEAIFNQAIMLRKHESPVVQSIEGDDEQEPAQATKEECARLIDEAARLRTGLGGYPIEEAIRAELWQDSPLPTSRRLEAFYERAELYQLEDEHGHAYTEVRQYVEDVSRALNYGLFTSILHALPESTYNGAHRKHTTFGRKALVKCGQEMFHLHERIVSDLLCFLVFLDIGLAGKYETGDLATERTFEALVDRLRTIQVGRWMASNTRSRQGHEITVLEDVFARVIHFRPYAPQPASASLTNSTCDLLAFSVGHSQGQSEGSEGVAPHILCDLLCNGNMDLAHSFLRFLPSTAWAIYVRARYCLSVKDCSAAATYFKKAAYTLSRPSGETAEAITNKSAKLLSPLEAGYFGTGLASYYTHVLELFSASSVHAYAQAAMFASLALQHRGGYQYAEVAKQRSDLLSRLFHASLALGDYDAAAAALARYTDKALRKAALKELVTNAIAAGAVQELLEIPFTETMKKQVDQQLSEMSRDEAESETEAAAAVKILYAWRVKHGDYRGAAACLVEKLQARHASGPHKRARVRSAGAKDAVFGDYLISINALALVGQSEGVEDAEKEGWLFVEKDGPTGPRNLVRLKDLRREYQEEMDRRENWEKGRFSLTADDEDDDGDAVMAM